MNKWKRLGLLAVSIPVALFWVSLVPWRTVADTLSIPYSFSPNTTIQSSQFNANFVAIRDLVNGNINDLNIKNLGITGSTKLIDSSVTLAKMADNSVQAAEIVDGSVGVAEIAANGVGTAEITDDSVTESKLNIASAPATGAYLIYNGSALDYRLSGDSITFTALNLSLAGPATVYFTTTGDFSATSTAIPGVPATSAATYTKMQAESAANLSLSTTFTLQKETAGVWADVSGFACQIAGSASTCSDTGTVTLAAGDQLRIKASVGAGSLATSQVAVSVGN